MIDDAEEIKFSKLTELRAQEQQQEQDIPAVLTDVPGYLVEVENITLNKGNGFAAVEYKACDGSKGAVLIDPKQIPDIVRRLLEIALEAGVIHPPMVTKISKIDSSEFDGEVVPFLFHFNDSSWWQYFLAPPHVAAQASELFDEMNEEARQIRYDLGVLDEHRTKH